jgi:hypothetical protein
VSSYIKEELNCLEFNIETNEEAYVLYETNPDNKEMGAVLKKAYPPVKEKVSSKEISKGVFVSNLPRE